MCLDAHAHGVRIQHDIFHTPNEVELTFSDQPTPPSYANYPDGRDLAESMSMWRVQTEGYTTHPGQLIGVVSRDAGFLDSPDTEWISGGVNSKGPNAVALGRHGNFFHWGFAASPTYMTEEAKDVFVNAIHYIARFDGQVPIARKSPGTMMRGAIDSAIEGIGDEGYARTVARYEGYRADDADRKAALQARIDAGETLTETERRMLRMDAPSIPDRLAPAARILSKATIAELENDPARVAALLREIRPYVRPAGWYELEVDADLLELGVGNADIAVLERSIALLNTADAARGRRLLERYTEVTFGTADQWTEWLAVNRERLFFTEAGGYKWLVDTTGEARPVEAAARDGALEGPAKDAAKDAVKNAAKNPVKATRSSPLASGLSVAALGEGRYALTLEIDVLEGWHAYDTVPESSPYTPLTFELELPDGVTLDGDWKRPKAVASIESPDLMLLEGTLAFRCELLAVELTDDRDIACTLSYQVCDELMCMPPTTKRLTGVLER